jgi:hypothetical protein
MLPIALTDLETDLTEDWAQLGNRGWAWDDVLPYFKKAENWEGEAGEVHGKDGPLFTSPMDRSSPLCSAVIAAGREIGLEYREDLNNLQPRRVGIYAVGFVSRLVGAALFGHYGGDANSIHKRPVEHSRLVDYPDHHHHSLELGVRSLFSTSMICSSLNRPLRIVRLPLTDPRF